MVETEADGGGGGGGGDTDVNVSGGGGGGGGGGGSISQSTIQKLKKILSQLDIDISQIDLSQLDNLNLAHKYDGKDSLQPSICEDSINDRYGVGKHFVRGTRDVGFGKFEKFMIIGFYSIIRINIQ
ncbi:hypothetical protein CDAR_499301 [Caerostris darwini]|uniref:Uncharacterized protein n=1 Tax=Caerostris darwini TaxID=1538125 RepID=A0AAV4P002_9ARAC|nr:hypothetical protein CDAR_499301 [Caerostris darwini]